MYSFLIYSSLFRTPTRRTIKVQQFNNMSDMAVSQTIDLEHSQPKDYLTNLPVELLLSMTQYYRINPDGSFNKLSPLSLTNHRLNSIIQPLIWRRVTDAKYCPEGVGGGGVTTITTDVLSAHTRCLSFCWEIVSWVITSGDLIMSRSIRILQLAHLRHIRRNG